MTPRRGAVGGPAPDPLRDQVEAVRFSVSALKHALTSKKALPGGLPVAPPAGLDPLPPSAWKARRGCHAVRHSVCFLV